MQKLISLASTFKINKCLEHLIYEDLSKNSTSMASPTSGVPSFSSFFSCSCIRAARWCFMVHVCFNSDKRWACKFFLQYVQKARVGWNGTAVNHPIIKISVEIGTLFYIHKSFTDQNNFCTSFINVLIILIYFKNVYKKVPIIKYFKIFTQKFV